MTGHIVEPDDPDGPDRPATAVPLPPARAERRAPGEPHSYLTEIAALADMVAVWGRMLARHQPNSDGMCRDRQCGLPGYGTPHVKWPCSSWTAADLAATIHRGGPTITHRSVA